MLSGFTWILASTLAGSARPGLLDDLDNDLEFARERGIKRIVTLTRRPLPAEARDAGFELIHFPVPDMGIPTPRACQLLCTELVADLDQRPTLLHCHGGLGRTGTLAACCLVNLGRSPEEAFDEVRRANLHYVQSSAQRQFIGDYGEWLTRDQAAVAGA